MPEVEQPENLKPSREILDQLIASRTDLTDQKREELIGNSSIYIPDMFDSRPVDTKTFSGIQSEEAVYRVWLKCTDELGELGSTLVGE